MELRCPHRKFGEMVIPSIDEGVVEMTCPSRWCGKRPGVVVLHQFSTRSGKLLATRKFRSPEGGK